MTRGAGGRPVVAVAVLLAALVSGCNTGTVGDKAGSDEPPVELVLGSGDAEGGPGTEVMRNFASRVADRSEGRVTVKIVWNAAGDATNAEGEIVRQVRDGELDLGFVGTRIWDGEGVRGLSALQAPFLIDDYAVLDAVLTSDLPQQMLAELPSVGMTGLGMYPDQLRHPLGFGAAFLSLRDFKGVTLRVPNSHVSDAVMTALGATPVHLSGEALAMAIESGDLAGAETSIGNALSLPTGSYLTTDVTFYPKVFTLFAASNRYSSLSDEARSILESAAADTFTYVLGQDLERADIDAFCALGGKLVAAPTHDVEALVAAAEPVTRSLEADPTVASYIERIRELKAMTSPAGHEMRCPG